MVADGEGPAAERVERLAERDRAGRSGVPPVRKTRLSRIGRETSQWPYSLTTQTRAPASPAASSSGAHASSSSRTRRGMSRSGRTEALRVVVEMRQIDQCQVGPFHA